MDTLVALAIFLVVQMVLRQWLQKAQLLLSPEDKVKLLDSSSNASVYQIAALPILLLGFAGLIYLKPSIFVMSIGMTVFIVLLAILTFASQRITYKRLCALGLPDAYIRQRRIANTVQSVCMGLFFAWLLGSYFWDIQNMGALRDATLK